MAARSENEGTSDGETYIEKYTRGVLQVENILSLERLRQASNCRAWTRGRDHQQVKTDGGSRSVLSNSLQHRGLEPTRLLCPWDSPDKNTGVDCHALLQGTFPTQGSNPGLLYCRQILYHLTDHQPSPQMDKDELTYQHTFSLNPWEKEDLSSRLIRQNSYFDKRVTQIQTSAFYWTLLGKPHYFIFKMDDGGSCTAMGMSFVPLNCAVKYG